MFSDARKLCFSQELDDLGSYEPPEIQLDRLRGAGKIIDDEQGLPFELSDVR
jgi:hypothetical protein